MTETSGPPRPPLFAAPGWRVALLVALTFAMFVPLMLISFVVEDRVSYRRAALQEVAWQWGGQVSLDGPMLVIPVERTQWRKVENDEGVVREEPFTELSVPVVLRPETLDIAVRTAAQVRKRGIFEVPVYTADIALAFDFATDKIAAAIAPEETVLWDQAALAILMPATRSFTGQVELDAGERRFDLEPGTPGGNRSAIHARLGDPRGLGAFTMKMGLNGAEAIHFAPAGRQTNLAMTSDWAHPSFSGAFLPRAPEIGADGFSANWGIPHLARDARQVSRGLQGTGGEFGVRFYRPVDLYQKTQRAVKYGILFIALTFLTVFLCERLSARPAHLVHFLLIGAAQCVFFVLLLSLAEQIGFSLSYLAAGAATIGLITLYGATGLGLGRKASVLGGTLAVLYGTLYLILRSTDYALLAGSILAFIAVALAMLLTRGEDWSGAGTRAQPA